MRPVVLTLLSPSITASRRVQQFLTDWVGLTPINNETLYRGDALDNSIVLGAGAFPFLTPIQWDSIDLTLPGGSTRLHLLAPKTNGDRTGPLSLLALQQADSIQASRDLLAQALPRTANSMALGFQFYVQRKTLPVRHLLGPLALPLLQWSERDDSLITSASADDAADFRSIQLKEVVIPVLADGMDQSLFSTLSALERTVVGLYRFPNSNTCLRPLPCGKEDHGLPPPSLIFHVHSLNDVLKKQPRRDCDNDATGFSRIGFNSIQKGQVMLRSPILQGLDLRFCASTKRSSVFAEAQESLLAGSLPELQSTHVLDKGGNKDREADPRTNNSDCWVEFRATLKRKPLSFLPKRSTMPKIANTPDLPYQ